MELLRADPLAPALRPLILRHLREMEAASPPGSSHALDPEALAEPGMAFFLLQEAGLPCAFGALKPLEPGHGELKSMHVLAEARGRGLGRRLLRGLMAQAVAAGMERVSLETGRPPAYAAAVALYLAEGFAECPPFAGYGPDPASLFLTRRLA